MHVYRVSFDQTPESTVVGEVIEMLTQKVQCFDIMMLCRISLCAVSCNGSLSEPILCLHAADTTGRRHDEVCCLPRPSCPRGPWQDTRSRKDTKKPDRVQSSQQQ